MRKIIFTALLACSAASVAFAEPVCNSLTGEDAGLNALATITTDAICTEIISELSGIPSECEDGEYRDGTNWKVIVQSVASTSFLRYRIQVVGPASLLSASGNGGENHTLGLVMAIGLQCKTAIFLYNHRPLRNSQKRHAFIDSHTNNELMDEAEALDLLSGRIRNAVLKSLSG